MTRIELLERAKPILFNTEMVRAIQDGRKTVTRRVIKPRFRENECGFFTATIAGQLFLCYSDEDDNETRRIKALYQIGDILYMRETWCRFNCNLCDGDTLTGEPLEDDCPNENGYCYRYRASHIICGDVTWKPSIHMPKEAARIFLRVKKISVERLQNSFFKSGSTIFTLLGEGVDIGEQCGECIDTYGSACCIDDESECGTLDEVRSDYSDLWNRTVKKSDLEKYGWAANPWVFVIEFERVEVSDD